MIDFGLLFGGLILLPGSAWRLRGGCEEAAGLTFPPPSPPRTAP